VQRVCWGFALASGETRFGRSFRFLIGCFSQRVLRRILRAELVRSLIRPAARCVTCIATLLTRSALSPSPLVTRGVEARLWAEALERG
jgi:hypothetical protein